MILALADSKMLRELHECVGKRGCVYEYIDEAMPTSVNGYPVFFSLKILPGAEWTIVRELLKRLEKAQREALMQ